MRYYAVVQGIPARIGARLQSSQKSSGTTSPVQHSATNVATGNEKYSAPPQEERSINSTAEGITSSE